MMRTLGVVLGVTCAGLLFSNRREVHAARLQLADASAGQTFIPAFQDVFSVATTVCLLAFGLALLRSKERT
jgi:hypothetical protein